MANLDNLLRFATKLYPEYSRWMYKESLDFNGPDSTQTGIFKETLALAKAVRKLDKKILGRYSFKKLYPIAAGLQGGLIYATHNPNSVVKITTDKSEYKSAQRIEQLALDHVVHIFRCNKFAYPGRDDKLIYITEMEKLEPLPKQYYNVITQWLGPDPTSDEIELLDLNKASESGKKILQQLINMKQELNEFNLVHADMHVDNLMINKDGVIKLVDVAGFI